MMFKICSLLIATISLQFDVSFCDHTSRFCPNFTVTFTAMTDQIIDDPADVLSDDPEQTFFKKIMGFRDSEIQHVFSDAIKYFNNTYGLDFSFSQPNEKNEYFFENAKMNLYRFPDDIREQLVLSNWIQTGNTRSECRDIYVGGIRVSFSGDQILHGSYGGVDGLPVGVDNVLLYEFSKIDVCDQSPVVIVGQSVTPFRREPVDGFTFMNFDLYSHVLGHGKAIGLFRVQPAAEHPGKFHTTASRLVNHHNLFIYFLTHLTSDDGCQCILPVL